MARPIDDTTIIRRFFKRVVIQDGCWGWIGQPDGYGYGRLQTKQRFVMKAHRVSFEFFNGPIPPGMFVCHRCDNPACTNPAHLFLGTSAENQADMANKGRSTRGTKHKGALLNESQVREIRQLSKEGKTRRQLATRFQVPATCIKNVLCGRSWTWLR